MVVELPELLPLELPVLGDVGDAGGVVALPLVPPVPALEPDLLKWASHSAREIWPSLFVSTVEKLGVPALPLLPDMPPLVPPAAAPPVEDDAPDDPLDMSEEPLALPPDAAGEDVDLSLLVLLDEELCASATPDSAKSAAAVAALSIFRFNIG